MDKWKGWGGYYHRRLAEIYRNLCPPGKRVLELGCAHGDLLAALKPSTGVGVDFSPEMILRARERHPELIFIEADALNLNLEDKFDFIILSDLVNDLWDVQEVFRQVGRVSTRTTRIIVNFYSHLWEWPLRIAQKLGLAKPNLPQNWLTVEDVTGLLKLAGFEVIRHWEEILLPLPIPLVSPLANRYLVKIWPFSMAALTHLVVARPLVDKHAGSASEPAVSVIIPARNEAGNIAAIFERTPPLGRGSEFVFVEGGSSDDTRGEIERMIAAHPERPSLLLRQTGKGKGDAVRLGFANSSGDILIVLDADLTVPPEDLPRFIEVLVSGKADFANGSRLVYPMEREAMQFFNLVGNKFFSLAFSWLLGQQIKDTLCGTKALWKTDYDAIAANRAHFGDFDPFGDFDLLFGASRLSLRIVDVPVRYRDRTYGSTNIQRWTHGWLLLRMALLAARRLKFV
jgi:SAM-dependent methyltransferase